MNKELINDYYLERYVLEELPDEYAEEIRQLASTNSEIQVALKNIETSNHDILSKYPSSTVKAHFSIRLKESKNKPLYIKPILYISTAVTAALLFLFLIHPGLKKETGIKPPDIEKDVSLVKGIPAIDFSRTQLLVYRKIRDQVEMLTDGKGAKTGDLLQLAYVAAKDPYGIILSIDGRGTITRHFPAEEDGATDLVLNKKILLPNAIELDDAPDFERFFFITSRFPIDLENILKEVETLARDPERVEQEDLDLPEGIHQYSVLILKGGDS